MSKARVDTTFSTIAELCSAGVIASGNPEIRAVCTDSRVCEPESLFVALAGERSDGHRYIEDARNRGAIAAMISADWAGGHRSEVDQLRAEGMSFLLCPSPLSGLQALAAEYRRRVTEPFTIGITGSNGKTTTKELLGSILRGGGNAYVTRGNLNSEIGLPLSVLELTNEHRFGVFEMAMNHPGEMRDLARVLRPRLALITNIGTAHIGILGSKQAIAEEKKQIFSQFTGAETAFLYESEPYYDFLRKDVKGEIVMYGERSTPGYRGYRDLGVRGNLLFWYDREIHLPLPGAFNVRNALAAMAVAIHVGMSEEQIATGIEGVATLFGRSEVLDGPVTIVQDCYNANPDSVREAVSLAARTERPNGRTVLVLGDMAELGAYSAELHDEVLKDVAASGADRVFLFGELFREAASRLRDAGELGGTELSATSDFDQLRRHVVEFVREGDLVLIKGSRSMELERLTPYLREE